MEPKLLLAWNPRPGEFVTTEEPKRYTVEQLQELAFFASISSTSQRQSATQLDNTYSVMFKTHDSNLMELGKVPPLTLVRVTVEIIDERDRFKPDEERDIYYE